jgi:uncharacterized protein (TIGR02145 family)
MVSARGVVYGTAQNPTTANSTTSDGTGTGTFTSTLTGLTASTLYYVRAYATNSVGTAYGNEVSFTTLMPLSTVTVTLMVDVTDYVAGGATIAANGLRVGGTFGTLGATSNGTPMLDWNPTDAGSAMTDIGNNVWSKVVQFPITALGNTLNWRFVNGNWGANEGAQTLSNCGIDDAFGGFNRASPIVPVTVKFCWNSCTQCDGSSPIITTSAPQPCPGTPTVTDVDNNTYNTVQIGNQCWTQSNLKVSKYRNGDNIPTGVSDSAWQSTTSGAYAIYDNNPVNDGLFGKLYNHYAVSDSRGLCPTGWHVPTDGEWNVMVKNLDPNADTVCGGCTQSSIAGGALKSTAIQPTTWGWASPNTGATNSSGFTATPNGIRYAGGPFGGITGIGAWWSSFASSASTAWIRNVQNSHTNFGRYNDGRAVGWAVRCLKD